MSRQMRIIAAAALLFAAAQPANASGRWFQFWPSSDAELGTPRFEGLIIDPDVGFATFDLTGSGSDGFKDAKGIRAGGQIGYDWQTGIFLYGLIADGAFTWAERTGRGAATGYRAEIQSVGSLRAKLGIVRGRFLVYGTGGVAFGTVELDGPTDEEETLTGWTAGGGIEWAWGPRTFLRAEYRRFDLGEERFDNLPAGGQDLGVEADLFKIGFTRRF